MQFTDQTCRKGEDAMSAFNNTVLGQSHELLAELGGQQKQAGEETVLQHTGEGKKDCCIRSTMQSLDHDARICF